MGIYKCSADATVEISLTVDSDNDIKIELEDEYSYGLAFLSKGNAQKLANELNQLLMEGKGNE